MLARGTWVCGDGWVSVVSIAERVMVKAFVKNWASFQHYKDRRPPWIKLHHSILEDYSFACLPIASKALAPCIWLLASESEDGSFDATPDVISFRTHIGIADVRKGLKPLYDAGFIVNDQPYAGDVLADRLQAATPETETETERETEKDLGHRADDRTRPSTDFDTRFWPAFPRKVAKANAQKAFAKINPDEAMLGKMLAALAVQKQSADWLKDGGQYVPHPATWLNGRRWEDEPEKPRNGTPLVSGMVL